MNESAPQIFSRGSEWRKWDLHFHTPSSYDYKDKSITNENIIEALKQNSISVVAITDHHVIDEKRIKELQQLAVEKITILPGIEFCSNSRGNEPIHFIGIFPENANLDYIWTEINSKAGIAKQKENGKNDNEIYCELKATSLLIRDLGGVVSIHAGSKSHSLETITNSLPVKMAEKKDIADHINIFELGQLKDQQDYEEKVFPEVGFYPMIICSDNHNVKDYSIKQNCWVKADPTFEGLKQIIHEPKSGERVFIGDIPPTHKNPSKVIDRIEIKNSMRWFSESPILLNDGLISVIGEKGSGKTALADFVAFAGGDFVRDEEDQASFIYKALKPTKQIGETIKDCKVTLFWKNSDTDVGIITDDLGKYEDKKKVRYLSQSFIEKKCHPDYAEELQKEIENIVFQHIPISDRLGETTFDGLRKRKTESITLREVEYRKDISELNEEIFKLENTIASLGQKQEEKNKAEKEVSDLEAAKPKPSTEKEKAIESKLAALNEHKNNLESQIATFKVHLTTIENIKTKVTNLKTQAAKQLDQIQKDLFTLGIAFNKKIEFTISPDFTSEIESKQKDFTDRIEKLVGRSIETNIKGDGREEVEIDILPDEKIKGFSLNETCAWITILESISSIVATTRKTIKEYDDKLFKIKKRIGELDQDLVDIEKIKKPELPEKKKKRECLYKEYFDLLLQEKKILENLYSPLGKLLDSRNTNPDSKIQLEFFARIELDTGNFFGSAKEIINFSKTGKYLRGENNLFKIIRNTAETIELGECEDIAEKMSELYATFEMDKEGNSVSIDSQLLKEKTRLDFYNWIYNTSYFKVAYSIKYQETSLELLSPGKRGIVLLLMYLVLDTESDVPLVIDQPEENLDNKSVFPSLADYFREIKKRRQVVIVTHNPNLVLNTDAEQIIVANFDGALTTQMERIKYLGGAIENSFVREAAKIPMERRGIREHGLDILEGGKTAFRKRREKYGKTAE